MNTRWAVAIALVSVISVLYPAKAIADDFAYIHLGAVSVTTWLGAECGWGGESGVYVNGAVLYQLNDMWGWGPAYEDQENSFGQSSTRDEWSSQNGAPALALSLGYDLVKTRYDDGAAFIRIFGGVLANLSTMDYEPLYDADPELEERHQNVYARAAFSVAYAWESFYMGLGGGALFPLSGLAAEGGYLALPSLDFSMGLAFY